MTGTAHLQNVLRQKSANISPTSPAILAANKLIQIIQQWGSGHIAYIAVSGSYAKGTAVKGGTDIDLFISIKSELNMSLGDIYKRLSQHLRDIGFAYVREQNVSIGVTLNGIKVDLVPAKSQGTNSEDHSLYKRKANSWTKTNVLTHQKTVSESGRLSEIRLMKLWRNQKNINFPSFYLELSVISALHGQPFVGRNGDLSTNIVTVLKYLKENFVNARIVDPANKNNIISDDLTFYEKQAVVQAAQKSLNGNWAQEFMA